MGKNIKSEIYFNKIERRIFHFDESEPVIRPLFYYNQGNAYLHYSYSLVTKIIDWTNPKEILKRNFIPESNSLRLNLVQESGLMAIIHKQVEYLS
mmetsp:Transcript_19668/g.3225  ORF Transcript_19668/g.3225 Transcript_19668/m.3225 type:complete len:95 (-) Transcript_19668:376-660(-)